MSQSLPRGIRNHNPGNLRKSNDKWQGLAPIQSDSAFFVFDGPLWGIRAMAILLINYQDKYGLDTIQEIIDRWAPPVENNTAAYVASVAQACGVRADQEIDVREMLPCLVRAIIRHENGQLPYSDELLAQAIELARKAKS